MEERAGVMRSEVECAVLRVGVTIGVAPALLAEAKAAALLALVWVVEGVVVPVEGILGVVTVVWVGAAARTAADMAEA